MKQRPRKNITDAEMVSIRGRWEKGESINAVARNPDYESGRQFVILCYVRLVGP